MPIVDYNLTSIVDKQMYETLTISQYSIIYNNTMPYQHRKKKFIILFMILQITLLLNTILEKYKLFMIFILIFLEMICIVLFKQIRMLLRIKVNIHPDTYYYIIKRMNNTSKYLISLVDSDYSASLIASLRNQIIYIQYGFFIIFALQ